MTDYKHQAKERLTRQQAADRLTDIAYALAAGGSLELNVEGQRITIPISDELGLERSLKTKGDRIELALELRWSRAEAEPVSAAPAGQPFASGQLSADPTR